MKLCNGYSSVISKQSSIKVKVGWNEGTSGPSPISDGINVQVNSFSNTDGGFVCSFTLDEEMKFKVPGKPDICLN